MMLGIIGALIGGLIASIPWIVFYVYFKMLWSILAFPIAFFSYLGYKLFKGKQSNKLSLIITLISIFTITIVTLIIIPLLLLIKDGVSLSNFQLLYKSTEFKKALFEDYIFSLLFTLLGISGLVVKINQKDIKYSERKKIDLFLSVLFPFF